MKEKFIKYIIEEMLNKQLYEKKIIDENTYKIVSEKIQKILYNKNKEEKC